MKRTFTLGAAALTGFFAGASVLVTAHAAADMNEVKSESFVLVSKSGRIRGEFTLDAQGDPVLRLYDAHGRITWEAPTVRPIPLR